MKECLGATAVLMSEISSPNMLEKWGCVQILHDMKKWLLTLECSPYASRFVQFLAFLSSRTAGNPGPLFALLTSEYKKCPFSKFDVFEKVPINFH
jgi:hypothetical protein